ncbi:urea carboxylase-associated family protein [Hoeflea sp.]|uniref:urea carboxylase-associated family protein n=1 Tax=Hoeflea sp. TaxID=1940281 RepID=UPI0025BFF4A7|nr:urea carboxylase-associated family protein [Hoeflea sp.]MBU4529038.1 urea carboxylase-associated family protein [Alphaproteobacteria bacterium]MBU4543443.1 urea carboxylase-associated family protein [Alphaproteobacteria bacterium]MBU4549068.1 urea carboxylase-associated family protein [Alphaproteobacteria bacterium]
MTCRIPPRSGTAFALKKGQLLTVIDPEGQQVSDLVAFSADDKREYLSSGRSIDYAGRIFLTTGDTLYSNRSVPMLSIVEDEVGRHDFSLTPCSRDTFRIIYGDAHPHHGCQGNLETALAPYGIEADAIPIAFNVFMHVAVNSDSGEFKVLPPLSKPGQKTVFRAEMDLIVALTACSAGQSNNFRYKPIDYRVEDAG